MRPSWTLVSSVFSLRMVGDWPGVTPPHNGFTRPRWARETDRERDGKRVEGCQKERNWTRKWEERSQCRERERESRSLSEAGRARGWKTGRGEREEGNGSHIDFPMFPRIVTIAPGEGARRRQVPPSSTIPRASHPSTTTPRAANYPVCSVLPTDGRPMRERDYGRWTCVSFRPFVSFSRFFLSPLFFSFPSVFCCPVVLPLPSSSLFPFFFSPTPVTSRNFQDWEYRTVYDAILKIVSNVEYGIVLWRVGGLYNLEKS